VTCVTVLDLNIEAAELAEAARDYRSAIRYLMSLSGKEIALRILTLSKRLGDENAIPSKMVAKGIAQAHQKVAESFWQENNYTEALQHFQQAGNLESASDCYQKLGEFGLAIQFKPAISSEWMQDIRSSVERTVRTHIGRKEFLAAIRLLKSVEEAWRKKSPL
jgi:molecular chaperone DnaK